MFTMIRAADGAGNSTPVAATGNWVPMTFFSPDIASGEGVIQIGDDEDNWIDLYVAGTKQELVAAADTAITVYGCGRYRVVTSAAMTIKLSTATSP